ncbi:laccase-1-like [Venturia canescens]|uniref:laccase-1-like n=1 Tax=Venturia canescens TaxID=32260 RepID=UPI001C9D0B35|nr:laccase-1-like [Venturia canescens]XP_043270973.1 laccase-1-like [Venturia canescens]
MFSLATSVVYVGIISAVENCFAASIINSKNEIDFTNEFVEPDEIDWRDHPCRRECVDGERPMDCKYAFKVESYYAMSKACYNCPFNATDCFRPHCVPADGVKRSIQVVNRRMPGPSIEVCQGDRLIIDVTNMMLAESTTMHWHGQHNRATPYMDGVPYVTQCPILPGATFRYQFVAENAGTHFWHSHSGFQRGDGVFGALVVRLPPSKDPHRDLYDFDDHQMIILDWDHEIGTEKFLAHHHSVGGNKAPNLLVNGLGRYERAWDATNATKVMPVATFSVEQGSRYRFRLINAEFLNCPIEVSIDNHTLYVVSTDGYDIEPIEAESLVSYAGERFDFIVEMNQEIDNYWIRFRGLMDCDERFLSAYQVAILRYEGADYADPNGTVSYERVPMNTSALQVNALNRGVESNDTISMPHLRSLGPSDESITREPDYKFYLAYDFYGKDNPHFHRQNLYGYHQVAKGENRRLTPQLNHISMKLPSFPLLPQRDSILPDQFCNASTVHNCVDEFCACTHVLQVKLGSVVELVLIDTGFAYDANHPFHLHGHQFRVVAMRRVGENVTVETVKRLDEEGLIVRNLDRPPIKDTVTVPDGGYTIVRFHAYNPGYWLFHCHIEFHVEVGMGLVFKVGEHEDFEPVPRGFPQCGDWKPPSYPEPGTAIITELDVTPSSTTSTQDPTENEVSNAKPVQNTISDIVPILEKLHLQTSSSTTRSCDKLLLLVFCLSVLRLGQIHFN